MAKHPPLRASAPDATATSEGEPWGLTNAVQAAVELLALAWTVPLLILLVIAPIGLVISGVLWVARRLFGV